MPRAVRNLTRATLVAMLCAGVPGLAMASVATALVCPIMANGAASTARHAGHDCDHRDGRGTRGSDTCHSCPCCKAGGGVHIVALAAGTASPVGTALRPGHGAALAEHPPGSRWRPPRLA